MKLIKILTVLMILTFTVNKTNVDFTASVMNEKHVPETCKVGTINQVGSAGFNSSTRKQEDKTVQPASTYDRFDPYTLQGKVASTQMLVL